MRCLPTLAFLYAACVALAGAVVHAGEVIAVSELAEKTHFHGIAVGRADPSRIYLATHHGLFVASPDGVATRVSEQLQLSVDLLDTFKNRPPTAATKKNDVAIVTAITAKF